jgi:signal transduction histidine kinase
LLTKKQKDTLAREQAAVEAARSANRAKDLFLAMTSHELRTPLTAISGWVELLQKHELDEKDRNYAVEVIKRNAKIQAQLIEDLIDLARITEGKLNLQMYKVNIKQVVERAIDVVRLSIAAKEIKFSATLPADEIIVWGDGNRLQQTIWNLLSNAVKFTPRDGQVGIEITPQDNNVKIIVWDSGKGIDKELLPYIFDRFRQGADSQKAGGLGLGLTIARYLVEMHGGTIEAFSAGASQGARFTINLPINRPDHYRSEKYDYSDIYA